MTSAELSDWLRAHQAVLTAKPDPEHYEQIRVEIDFIPPGTPALTGPSPSPVALTGYGRDVLEAAEHAIRQGETR